MSKFFTIDIENSTIFTLMLFTTCGAPMPLTYSSYLHLTELLNLQHPLSEDQEHDEHLFIIVHQVYELWFKQLIHEMCHLRRLFNQGDTNRALHTIKRLNAIFRTIIQQLDVIETLTPLEFLSFRNRLQSASGFQSSQFRELEFLFGFKNADTINNYPKDSKAYKKLQQRLFEPSLWDGFLHLLSHKQYRVPEEQLNRDLSEKVTANNELQIILITIYKSDPAMTQICEAMVDLDAALQDWRYRHVKMVERTIGTKIGTGGSDGVHYLKQTLFKPAFPDLWAIRAKL